MKTKNRIAFIEDEKREIDSRIVGYVKSYFSCVRKRTLLFAIFFSLFAPMSVSVCDSLIWVMLRVYFGYSFSWLYADFNAHWSRE